MTGLHLGDPPTELALGHWSAPAGCRRIEFFSDVHLEESRPRTWLALQGYLDGSDADVIVILGDLFEVWIGDDARNDGFAARCLALLSAAARRRPLAFMVGNRDFLVGAAFLGEAGITALADATLAEAFDQRILLSHGDAWCLADRDYLAFRRQVRAPQWQAAFLARPIEERRAAAAGMREASESHKRERGPTAYADVDEDQARAALHATGAGLLLHGHTHRPGVHDLGDGLGRWVLSDWEFDFAPGVAARSRGDVLRWEATGLSRHAVQPDGSLLSIQP